MFGQSQETPGVYNVALKLAKAAGVAAAILITPALFEWSRPPLFRYFAKSYGQDIALWLVWAMGGLEAFVIYSIVVMAMTFCMIWLLAILAARGLSR